jgi:hypothetical protein
MPTDVAFSLPQLDLRPGSIVTVVLDDASAVITAVKIHGYQEAPPIAVPLPAPLLGYTPTNA